MHPVPYWIVRPDGPFRRVPTHRMRRKRRQHYRPLCPPCVKKRYKYLWARCTSMLVINIAWRNLIAGKTDRPEVRYIAEHYRECALEMQRQIMETRPNNPHYELMFHPVHHRPKHINEYGKHRDTYCPSIWEQWLHHIIVAVLQGIIVKNSYHNSCGSMPGRGGHYGKKAIEKYLRRHKRRPFKYFAKFDIRHFFDSLDLDIVLDYMAQYIKDDWFLYLVRRAYYYFPVGIPLGFYISQWITNFVLMDIDKIIQSFHYEIYVRYADDFVIGGNNKRSLHKLIETVKVHLGKLHLRMKKNYQVARFDYFEKYTNKRKGRPIDFMGFVFYRNKTTIRKRIFTKIVKNANRIRKTYSISLKQARQMLSRCGWFKHTDTRNTYIKYIASRCPIRLLKNIVRKDSIHRTDPGGLPWLVKQQMNGEAFALYAGSNYLDIIRSIRTHKLSYIKEKPKLRKVVKDYVIEIESERLSNTLGTGRSILQNGRFPKVESLYLYAA